MAAIIFIKLSPFILAALGFLPSALWLILYLREDCHPEPKRLVLKVFAWGMLVAPLAVIIQYIFLQLWNAYVEPGAASLIESRALFTIGNLVGLAAIEEYLKYLVVKTEVEGAREFDEPVDAMEYMIIAALGFAAVENLLIAFSLAPSAPAGQAFAGAAGSITEASRVLGVRFLGATLLHASSSAIVGYGLARRLFGKKPFALAWGLILATLLHALFNYFILVRSEVQAIWVIGGALAMLGLTLGLLWRIRRLTKSHVVHLDVM